jgi:hypothetical protein
MDKTGNTVRIPGTQQTCWPWQKKLELPADYLSHIKSLGAAE